MWSLGRYRIEVDLTDPRRILQRHVWTAQDGRVRIEDWIHIGGVSADRLLQAGYRPVEPTPGPSLPRPGRTTPRPPG